jgi:hypothetical protein
MSCTKHFALRIHIPCARHTTVHVRMPCLSITALRMLMSRTTRSLPCMYIRHAHQAPLCLCLCHSQDSLPCMYMCHAQHAHSLMSVLPLLVTVFRPFNRSTPSIPSALHIHIHKTLCAAHAHAKHNMLCSSCTRHAKSQTQLALDIMLVYLTILHAIQTTTSEVNIARVYNHEVRQRQVDKDVAART